MIMRKIMDKDKYVEVNGRKIRIRPSGRQEIDENGYYKRQPNLFHMQLGTEEHPIEKDRYILFWSKGCAWSNRAAIVIHLLGLQDTIKMEVVDWTDHEENLGWEFVNSANHINPETGKQFLSEIYYATDPEYSLRTTVPVLVDYKTTTVVNNDFHCLTNLIEVQFQKFQKKNAPNLYPKHWRAEIDKKNRWLYENVNDAIYRACFAKSKEAYLEGYHTFFSALETLNEELKTKRFLFGDYVTDSDIRLYTTLVRLDLNYSRHIGPCLGRLEDYKNLWEYMRDLYQIPEFECNTFFTELACTNDKRFPFNPFYDIVIPQTDYKKIWKEPTKREILSKNQKEKFIRGKEKYEILY